VLDLVRLPRAAAAAGTNASGGPQDSTLIYSLDLSIPLGAPVAGDELDSFVIVTDTSTCIVYKRPGLDDFLKKVRCRARL